MPVRLRTFKRSETHSERKQSDGLAASLLERPRSSLEDSSTSCIEERRRKIKDAVRILSSMTESEPVLNVQKAIPTTQN